MTLLSVPRQHWAPTTIITITKLLPPSCLSLYPKPNIQQSQPLSLSLLIIPKTKTQSMQNTVVYGGGGVVSGGPTSTLSREEENNNNVMMMSSEESSSYPDESGLELGLGLSLGGGGGGRARIKPPSAAAGGSWDQYARILTAKEYPLSVVVSTTKASSSSSSSSSSVTKPNVNGTKRSAESPSSPPGRSSISQVVGWPPVRTYRMNSLASQAKSPVTEDFISTVDNKCEIKKNIIADNKTNSCGITNGNIAKENGVVRKFLFVKVNMDGIPIGRKVDLNAHSCYETLARALDDMFIPNAAIAARRSNEAGMNQPSRLSNDKSEFMLTYEDKDGDWMLVGDVPWEMFLNTVKRLRIMRKADANGLAPGSHERNRRLLKVPI